MLLGNASFAWQSDYCQFYLIDLSDDGFKAPVEITDAITARSFYTPDTGLVVYTEDCLQQHLRISIFDREPSLSPVEPNSGAPWSRLETTRLRFPSLGFSLSSPSSLRPMPGGPIFFVGSEWMAARLAWKESQESRDDSIPVEPDVIEITMWEAFSGDLQRL